MRSNVKPDPRRGGDRKKPVEDWPLMDLQKVGAILKSYTRGGVCNRVQQDYFANLVLEVEELIKPVVADLDELNELLRSQRNEDGRWMLEQRRDRMKARVDEIDRWCKAVRRLLWDACLLRLP